MRTTPRMILILKRASFTVRWHKTLAQKMATTVILAGDNSLLVSEKKYFYEECFLLKRSSFCENSESTTPRADIPWTVGKRWWHVSSVKLIIGFFWRHWVSSHSFHSISPITMKIFNDRFRTLVNLILEDNGNMPSVSSSSARGCRSTTGRSISFGVTLFFL